MWIKLFIKNSVPALVFAGLVYFNVVSLQSTFFGWVVLAGFFVWTSRLVHVFLVNFFALSQSMRVRVLAMFLVLAVIGFVAGILSWFYKMTPLILSITFFVVGLAMSYLKNLTSETADIVPEVEDDHKQVLEEMPSAKVGLVLYLVLVFTGFYFLNNSKVEFGISTPWQTISISYIYIFFAATVVLGCLLFSKLKSGTLLFLLILYALLLHAYLPLSHSLFYGADGWRHLAVENSMLSDVVEKGLSFSETPVSFWQRFNFGSLAYAQFNSLALVFKLVGQTELISYLRFFIPIVWSMVFPILLFEIARAFGWEKKRSLLFVWLSALPFALQVSGSFSLPSNLSLLFWLFVLLLQLKNKQNYNLVGFIFILILGLLSIFGHSLYFILFCLSFLLLNILNLKNNNQLLNKVKNSLAFIFLLLLIPSLELISNFSRFSAKIDWLAQFKAVLSSFSGWYVATGLRTSDITVGNIIFNQPPLNALVTNIFTNNRIWICSFMLLFWSIFILGWYKMLQKQKNNFNIVWLILSIGLLGGYVISRYFLIGENILSRRLDAVLAIFIILPVAYWLYEIIIIQKKVFYQRIVLFFVISFYSVAIVASYTLGPDSMAISKFQYLATDYIWQKERLNKKNICVLSDMDTLLVLEGLSGKKIVGGGFPMNLYFVQSEREELLKVAQTDPQLALSQSKKLLKIDTCYLVGDYNLPNPVAQFGQIKIYNN